VSKARSPLPSAARDQGTSEFTAILERIVADTPSARAAALFDYEGETVDYAGRLDPFDVKVTAATFQVLLAELRDLPRSPKPRQIRIQARGVAWLVRVLDDDYSLLIITHPRAGHAVSERVLRDAEARLATEAGLRTSARPQWWRVDVQLDKAARGSPVLVRPSVTGHGAESAWYGIDVLGCLVGLPSREKGFRIRLDSGIEANLIAERARARSRIWFVDEPLS
jgi:hypothetical protein